MIKAIFFDVANTLLEKPDLLPALQQAFEAFGHSLSRTSIALKHKELSEETIFPDKTTKHFYDTFNQELAKKLDIEPTVQLTEEIYQSCLGLKWRPYEDAKVIRDLRLPLGIGSNWDLSLKEKLAHYLPVKFNWILVSEELGIKKPHPEFFEKMVEVSGFSPENILFVGDSLRLDILPARKAGINTLLIDRLGFYSEYEGCQNQQLQNHYRFHMKRLAIIGGGDLGKQVAHHAPMSGYEVIGFFDDFATESLGGVDEVQAGYDAGGFDELMIGIGYKHMDLRAELFRKFQGRIPFGTVVHPSTLKDDTSEIGEGTFIYPGCTLDMNAKVGANVSLNVGCVIAHDSSIGDHSMLSPGVIVSGFVMIDEKVNLGTGTKVIDNITIKRGVRTGAGAVVTKNLTTSGLYVGIPAELKKAP